MSSTRTSRTSTTTSTDVASFTVHFVVNDRGTPEGKLADAELHFSAGPLDGLKLVGFAVWQRRGGGRNVTVPARQYSVNGELRLIRSRGHVPKGGYDVPHVWKQAWPTASSAVL